MPFKSEKQRAWMYANKPAMAKEWETHTPDKNLPKYALASVLKKQRKLLKKKK